MRKIVFTGIDLNKSRISISYFIYYDYDCCGMFSYLKLKRLFLARLGYFLLFIISSTYLRVLKPSNMSNFKKLEQFEVLEIVSSNLNTSNSSNSQSLVCSNRLISSFFLLMCQHLLLLNPDRVISFQLVFFN